MTTVEEASFYCRQEQRIEQDAIDGMLISIFPFRYVLCHYGDIHNSHLFRFQKMSEARSWFVRGHLIHDSTNSDSSFPFGLFRMEGHTSANLIHNYITSTSPHCPKPLFLSFWVRLFVLGFKDPNMCLDLAIAFSFKYPLWPLPDYLMGILYEELKREEDAKASYQSSYDKAKRLFAYFHMSRAASELARLSELAPPVVDPMMEKIKEMEKKLYVTEKRAKVAEEKCHQLQTELKLHQMEKQMRLAEQRAKDAEVKLKSFLTSFRYSKTLTKEERKRKNLSLNEEEEKEEDFQEGEKLDAGGEDEDDDEDAMLKQMNHSWFSF